MSAALQCEHTYELPSVSPRKIGCGLTKNLAQSQLAVYPTWLNVAPHTRVLPSILGAFAVLLSCTASRIPHISDTTPVMHPRLTFYMQP